MGKPEKKAACSPRCKDETTTCHDRTFSFAFHAAVPPRSTQEDRGVPRQPGPSLYRTAARYSGALFLFGHVAVKGSIPGWAYALPLWRVPCPYAMFRRGCRFPRAG